MVDKRPQPPSDDESSAAPNQSPSKKQKTHTRATSIDTAKAALKKPAPTLAARSKSTAKDITESSADDDMPSKTPNTNGTGPAKSGVNGGKDIEMKDDAQSSLKAAKGKKAKEGEDEMTVVVPPSKGSKLSAPSRNDETDDVAMGEATDDAEKAEEVKEDPVAKTVSRKW